MVSTQGQGAFVRPFRGASPHEGARRIGGLVEKHGGQPFEPERQDRHLVTERSKGPGHGSIGFLEARLHVYAEQVGIVSVEQAVGSASIPGVPSVPLAGHREPA